MTVSPGSPAAASRQAFPSVEQSAAYQQYVKRPKSELSKLIYLMDRFRDSKVQAIYDGNPYDATEAANLTHKYLARNYKKDQSAEHWVKIHSYSSLPAGNIIYIQFSNGQKRPARDVLLEELKTLKNIQGAS